MMKGRIGVRHGKHRESWFYKLYLGRDPMTGKKKYVAKRGYATKNEAEDAMELRISALTQDGRGDGEDAPKGGQ